LHLLSYAQGSKNQLKKTKSIQLTTMSENKRSHEESLKENEETRKEINKLQDQPKNEVGKRFFFFLNLISIT